MNTEEEIKQQYFDDETIIEINKRAQKGVPDEDIAKELNLGIYNVRVHTELYWNDKMVRKELKEIIPQPEAIRLEHRPIKTEGKTEMVAIHKVCDKRNRFYKFEDYSEWELQVIRDTLPSDFILTIIR